MDDLLNEFLTETAENLSALDVELVKFERDPTDAAILGSIFRMMHTIKGTCGFLGLQRLETVAHAGENVLGKFRDGELKVTPHAVTVILRCIDRIRQLLAGIEQAGSEPDLDSSELIAQLNAVAQGEGAPEAAAAAAPAATTAVVADGGFPVAAELLLEVESARASGVLPASPSRSRPKWKPSVCVKSSRPARLRLQLRLRPQRCPRQRKSPSNPRPPRPTRRSPLSRPLRSAWVSTCSRNLMTLVSELVLTRNQLLQMVRGQDDSEFKVPLQRLSHITSDLQDGVMKTRMQPIGNAWSKLPRIVRDLAVETGKKIELQMLGAETELDRQVLELIKDPLTHMVRNSADHGLESRPAPFGGQE